MKTRVGVGVWLGDLMNEDTCGCGCGCVAGGSHE